MLPPDVFEEILECLYQNNSWSSIKACAFVSPVFRQLAHKHIFSTVSLEYNCYPEPMGRGLLVLCEWPKNSAGHRLLAILDRAPYISRLIREVKFIAGPVPKSPKKQQALTDAVQAEMQRLGKSEFIYDDGTSAIPLTLETILPRLPNVKSLHIGQPFGLFWSMVNPKSQDAIVELCRNQLEEFHCYMSDFSEFPYKKLRGAKYLKRVLVRGLFTDHRTSADEDELSSSPPVLESFESGLIFPDDPSRKFLPHLFTSPNTIFNLSRLRRLVIGDSTSVDHFSTIALCAPTLEELEINFTGNRDCMSLSSPIYAGGAFNIFPPSLGKTIDFMDIPRLRSLTFVSPIVFYGGSVYHSALPWISTCLDTLPDDAALETLSVVLQGSLRPGQEQQILDPVELGVVVDPLVLVDEEEDSMGVTLRVKGLRSVVVDFTPEPRSSEASRDTSRHWGAFIRAHGDLESLRQLGLLRAPSS